MGHLDPSHPDQQNPHQVIAILAGGLLDKEYPLPRGPLHQPFLTLSPHASLRLSSAAIPSGMTQIPASPSPQPTLLILCSAPARGSRSPDPASYVHCGIRHYPEQTFPELRGPNGYPLQEWG